MPHFHDLDEDVVAQILVSLDIYTVLLLSRVNKSLRRLTFSKQLWIVLVLDLSSRYLIPHLHPIHNHTTAQLITKVKNLVCGPATWSERSSIPPTVGFSRTFLGGSATFAQSRILPGGRYFAVWRDSSLQCYDVLTGRSIWTGSVMMPQSWAMDMLPDGRAANFLLLSQGRLSIVVVDLTTGNSDEVFSLNLDFQTAQYRHPILSGDLLALGLVRYSPHKRVGIFIIDWREATYVIFESPAQPLFEVAFVPGHIILAPPALEPPYDRLVSVYALNSIASRWRPIAEFVSHNADVLFSQHIRLPEDVPSVVVESLQHNNQIFRSEPDRAHVEIRMRVHANPIHDNVYKLGVYASATAVTDTRPSLTETFRQKFQRGGASICAIGTMLFSYQLKLGGSKLSWMRTSVISNVPPLHTAPSWSYSGYVAICNGSSTRIVGPRSPRGFIRMLASQTVREVVTVSEDGMEYTALSSAGVLLIRSLRDDRLEIRCYL
ncbi:hypothetical protein MSAN_00599900 [Mycena sanguinolenta]|uniref:F-box domain-containing protein n=1 Tax=Mycena sanguinolenta TaxID=230812 RepID=A0A8H6ZAB8_9AGAR|nr:hypothetical protein MSAN_00599900 [Mycena sanguinolenta]